MCGLKIDMEIDPHLATLIAKIITNSVSTHLRLPGAHYQK